MDPSEFNYFGRFPDRSRELESFEDLREVFLGAPATSLEEIRRGIVSWRAIGTDSIDLKFFEYPGYGVYLQNSTWQNNRVAHVFFSLGDRDRLSEDLMMDLDEMGFALPGIFIAKERAFMAIEDFFEDPLTLSPRIDWIDAKDLPPWPEP